jgi:hypothetical protein
VAYPAAMPLSWRVSWFFLVVAAAAGALVGRLVLTSVTRRRWPAVAAAVERWWVWVPLAVVAAAAIWVVPVFGAIVTGGMLIALTTGKAVGSPFRPRR